jgi:FkbM family methyltransferase
MKTLFLIIRYIIQNNPWFLVPKKIVSAFFYQLYKRVTGGICSKKLFNGNKILLFPHNAISSALVYTNCPDKQEIFLLREYSDHNSIFLDIGANIGSYSLLMSDKVKSTFAFEAHPETVRFCKMNYLLNHQDPSQVIFAAVCAESGTKYFTNLSNGDPTNAISDNVQESIQVPALSLDDFIKGKTFSENTNFIIKMDVEGFEHEVFAGAKNFLTNYPVRAILFETFSSEIEIIKELLVNFGYQLQLIGKHNMLALKMGENSC